MKRIFMLSSITLIALAGIIVSGASAQSGMAFMGPEFAKKLCDSWNTSALPDQLGKAGTDWISKGKKAGTQTMVFWSKNCSTQRVQLTVEDQGGRAICTYGGAAQTSTPDWQIYPPVNKWYKCATGVNPMWQLMGNFSGDMGVAMKNMGNFKTFFSVAGKLAKENNADYKTGCTNDSGEISEIQGYLNQI